MEAKATAKHINSQKTTTLKFDKALHITIENLGNEISYDLGSGQVPLSSGAKDKLESTVPFSGQINFHFGNVVPNIKILKIEMI